MSALLFFFFVGSAIANYMLFGSYNSAQDLGQKINVIGANEKEWRKFAVLLVADAGGDLPPPPPPDEE